MNSVEQQIFDLYKSPNKNPMELARLICAYQKSSGLTLQALARALSLSPGSLHHYISLVTNLAAQLQPSVASGALSFKEARAIGDLPLERQVEVAEPFISGELSSVYIEPVIRYVRANPEASITEVVRRVVSNGILKSESEPSEPKPIVVVQPKSFSPSVERITEDVLSLAGRIDSIRRKDYSEVELLGLLSAMKTLIRRSISFVQEMDH